MDQQGILATTQEFSEKVSIQFLISSKEIIRYCSLNKNHEPVISLILRSYPGIFELQTNINITFISQKAKVTESDVLKMLEVLKQLEIISFLSQNNESKITFLTVREDDKTINWVSKYLEQQNEVKKNKLDAVIAFVSDENRCKNRILLEYFGENTTVDCGNCSICINKKNKQNVIKDISDSILEILNKEALTSRDLVAQLNIPENEILKNLHFLIENNLISINFKNQFTINKK